MYFSVRKIFLPAVMMLILVLSNAQAQKVAFIASDIIRDKFPEAKQAEQRVKSMVDDWKRELESMEKQIEDSKFEIKKNRLIWSDEEKRTKDKELEELQTRKIEFARRKFEAGGEYDAVLRQMMQPVEEKLYAAVQEVASDEGYDVIWDKSLQPLAYANSKYDLTVKVLRKLGVDVKALEKELQEKIDKDPRNQKKDSKTPPAKRTRAAEPEKKDTKTIDRDKAPTDTKSSKPDAMKPGPGSPVSDPSKLKESRGGGVTPIPLDTNTQKHTPIK